MSLPQKFIYLSAEISAAGIRVTVSRESMKLTKHSPEFFLIYEYSLTFGKETLSLLFTLHFRIHSGELRSQAHTVWFRII